MEHVNSVFFPFPSQHRAPPRPFPKQSGINWALMGFREVDLMGTQWPLHPFLPFRTGVFPLGKGRRERQAERQAFRQGLMEHICSLVENFHHPKTFERENRRLAASDRSTSGIAIRCILNCVKPGQKLANLGKIVCWKSYAKLKPLKIYDTLLTLI